MIVAAVQMRPSNNYQQKQSRIPSSYAAVLSDSMIDRSNIKLLELIGHGEWTIHTSKIYFSMFKNLLGEFGVVYRALLTKEDSSSMPTAVAVKTLKGIALLIYTSPCMHHVM